MLALKVLGYDGDYSSPLCRMLFPRLFTFTGSLA
jgi:hypothetical protein